MSNPKYPTGARVTITTGTDIRGLTGVIEGKQGVTYIVRVGGKIVHLPASSLKRTGVTEQEAHYRKALGQ